MKKERPLQSTFSPRVAEEHALLQAKSPGTAHIEVG